MQQFILSIINGTIFALTIFFKGKVIYPKQKLNHKDIIIAFAIYVTSFVINIYNFTPLFTIFFYYMSVVVFQKIIFKQELAKTLLVSLLIYGIRMLVEIVLIAFGLFHPSVIYATNLLPIEKFNSNVCSAIIALGIFILMQRIMNKVIKKVNNQPCHSFVIFTLIYFSLIFVFLIRMPYMKRDFNLLYDIVIIVLITIITGAVIDKENKMDMISKMYVEISNYAKSNGTLMEEYHRTLREIENNLTTIKKLLSKNKKEASQYVDKLVNEKESITSEWLKEFNNIPILGMKGFINLKMTEMKTAGITPEILVSPSVAKMKELSKEDVNDLYTIMGILLDGAIESSKNNKEKMVSIQMYEENEKIHIIVANSFDNEPMPKQLNEIKYPTTEENIKKEIIRNITKNKDIYQLETKIFQNFFVQDIIISI